MTHTIASETEKRDTPAQVILLHVVTLFPHARSIVDVGCGVGTWLCVARGLGFRSIRGYDAPWMPLRHLVIPHEDFECVDLRIAPAITVERRYDVAVCLEVAEHLPVDSAGPLVGLLASLSDVVLFSAATPGQGGIGHINERQAEYWGDLFGSRGYAAFDTIRPLIAEDARILPWYKNNIRIYRRMPSTSGFLSPGRSP